MTKKQMIVEAIETLGPDCSLEAVQRHVKNQWRETVNGQLFYSTRKAMKAARSYTEPPPPDEPLPVQNTAPTHLDRAAQTIWQLKIGGEFYRALGTREAVESLLRELSEIAH